MKKIVALLAALILALSMMSIASAEPIKSTYNLSEVSFIDQVGWYWTRDLSLILRDDTHYELFYREYVFGTTDPGLKGNKLIVYSAPIPPLNPLTTKPATSTSPWIPWMASTLNSMANPSAATCWAMPWCWTPSTGPTK